MNKNDITGKKGKIKLQDLNLFQVFLVLLSLITFDRCQIPKMVENSQKWPIHQMMTKRISLQ
jgi:hypothetical protein